MLHDVMNTIRDGFLTYLEVLFGIGLRIADESRDYWEDHAWLRYTVYTLFWGTLGLTVLGLILMIWGVINILHFNYSAGCWKILWATICNGLAYVMLGILGKSLQLGGLLGLLLKETLVDAPEVLVKNVFKWLGELVPWTIKNGQALLRYIGAFIPDVTIPEMNEAFEMTDFEAPEMDPVFNKAEKRIKAVIGQCVLIGKTVNRYFLLNFGVATLIVFLNLLGSELPTPTLGSLFIGAGVLFLIAITVYKLTESQNYERVAKLAAWIISIGIGLIGLEYGTGAFSWVKVHGAQAYAERHQRLVELKRQTYSDNFVLAGMQSINNATVIAQKARTYEVAQSASQTWEIKLDERGNPIKGSLVLQHNGQFPLVFNEVGEPVMINYGNLRFAVLTRDNGANVPLKGYEFAVLTTDIK